MCRLWNVAMLVLAGVGMAWTSVSAAPPDGSYWPQWRGPLGTGVAPDASPPLKWSETKNVRWKVEIPGSGTSTPIVWENKIFIGTAIPTEKKVAAAETPPQAEPSAPADRGGPPSFGRGRGGFGGMLADLPTDPYQFALLCLDRATGKTLWQRVAREELPHEGHHRDHGYASFSPVTDGERVYAYFGSRGLYCYDMEGNLQWEEDLGQMETKNSFGEGSSPALHGNVLVINWDHEGDDFIVAFDKHTGEELWRQARDEDTTWATPLIVEHEGVAQVVTSGTNKVRSYDLRTGELVWECEGLTQNAIPTPVSADGMVYATSGFRGNELLAIRLGFEGDLTDTEAIVWSHDRSTPYVPSPLLYDDRLYLVSGNNAILSAFVASSGKPLFGPERVPEIRGIYASPVGAADRVYVTGREGTTVVVDHADQFNVLAVNMLDDPIDASPAIVEDELFLRGHKYLYCIAEEAAGR